jgi:hypothetical protein
MSNINENDTEPNKDLVTEIHRLKDSLTDPDSEHSLTDPNSEPNSSKE